MWFVLSSPRRGQTTQPRVAAHRRAPWVAGNDECRTPKGFHNKTRQRQGNEFVTGIVRDIVHFNSVLGDHRMWNPFGVRHVFPIATQGSTTKRVNASATNLSPLDGKSFIPIRFMETTDCGTPSGFDMFAGLPPRVRGDAPRPWAGLLDPFGVNRMVGPLRGEPRG